MNKFLYIGHCISKPKTGGEVGTANIQNVLKTVFSKNFIYYDLHNKKKIESFFNKFLLIYPGLSFFDFHKIKKFIIKTNPFYIFIETAQYGALVKYIKKHFPQIKIITYFHNIEIEYAKSYFSFSNPKSWYFYILTKHNELSAIKFSDYVTAINETDSENMQFFYKRKPDFIFPFSTKNLISETECSLLEMNKQKIYSHNCLFIGSNFFGNTDGLLWFIKNVLPSIDIHLTIVGNGMSKAFSCTKNIAVFDYVEDLSVFYKEADFVLLPIISGGGMKTKTADAMMWGKAIIGTPAAFFGYNIENLNGIYLCKNASDFITAIKNIYSNNIYNFNLSIHNRFCEYHSIEITCEKVKKFFSEK